MADTVKPADDPLEEVRILLAESWTLVLNTALAYLRMVHFDNPLTCQHLEEATIHCLELLAEQKIALTQELGWTLREIRACNYAYPAFRLPRDLCDQIDGATQPIIPNTESAS